MQKICEDSTSILEQNLPANILRFMLEKFIQLSASPLSKVRYNALSSVNFFIIIKSPTLFSMLNNYIFALSQRANDTVPEIRKLVCQAFVLLVEAAPEVLLPQLNDIVNFMVHATQDQDDQVALEACEFWICFTEHDQLQEKLIPFLHMYVILLLL